MLSRSWIFVNVLTEWVRFCEHQYLQTSEEMEKVEKYSYMYTKNLTQQNRINTETQNAKYLTTDISYTMNLYLTGLRLLAAFTRIVQTPSLHEEPTRLCGCG